MSDNCEFNFANILVPLSVDVFVSQESLLVTNASCPGDVGQITGSVDGPTEYMRFGSMVILFQKLVSVLMI